MKGKLDEVKVQYLLLCMLLGREGNVDGNNLLCGDAGTLVYLVVIRRSLRRYLECKLKKSFVESFC